jgi:hypothetical protein
MLFPCFKPMLLIQGARIGIIPLFQAIENPFQRLPQNNTILFFNPTQSDTSIPFIAENLTLSGLPDTTSVTFVNVTLDSGLRLTSMDSAILICDPRSSIVPAEVTLAQNTLTAKQLPGPVNSSTLLGNIGPETRATITSGALLSGALGTTDVPSSSLSPTSKSMFLKIHEAFPNVYDIIGIDNDLVPIPVLEWEPLSLDEINRNMDLYIQSAGKAFLSGIAPTRNQTSTVLMRTSQTARLNYPVTVLISSKPFLIAFTAEIGMILILLAALFWTIRDTDLELFNLANITAILTKSGSLSVH